MQFSRYLTYSNNTATFRLWPIAMKLVLAVVSFYYVISKILNEQFIFNELILRFNSFEFVLTVLTVFILMGVNWLLESKKWQLIAQKYQPIRMNRAIKAILTGISLDAILPFGSGAIGSKVLSLDGSQRQKMMAPIILAQGIQSFWTVVFGLIGLTQIARMTDVYAMYGGKIAILVTVSLSVLLIIALLKFWPKIFNYLIISIRSLSINTWSKIIAISFFRYLVFLTQLALLMLYLAPELPIWIILGCITWMFFAKTIIPKPGHLGAVGIRGAAVVFFLSLTGYPYAGVVLATVLLWFINLAIPSLIGVFFLNDLKFKPISV